MTHKSEDYKISAVKYYLNNKDNIRKTCNMISLDYHFTEEEDHIKTQKCCFELIMDKPPL